MFNKFCDRISGLMMVWVAAACAAGYLWPWTLTWMKPYLEWLFALTMLGIGIVTPSEDFDGIVQRPKPVFLGLAAHYGIMPLSAFLVAKILHLPGDLATGLIIAGSAPDAMAANVISYAAKADVAYAVAFTGAATVAAPLLTPAFVWIFARTYLPIPFWPMVVSILKMVIIPLILGMGLKRAAGRRMDGMKGLFPALSALFVAAICGLVTALNKSSLAAVSGLIFAGVFLVNALGLSLGYRAGALFGFDLRRRRTLAFCVGMQNAGLGAVLAIRHVGQRAAVPNALFAAWCVLSASLLAWYWSRRAPNGPASSTDEPALSR